MLRGPCRRSSPSLPLSRLDSSPDCSPHKKESLPRKACLLRAGDVLPQGIASRTLTSMHIAGKFSEERPFWFRRSGPGPNERLGGPGAACSRTRGAVDPGKCFSLRPRVRPLPRADWTLSVSTEGLVLSAQCPLTPNAISRNEWPPGEHPSLSAEVEAS